MFTKEDKEKFEFLRLIEAFRKSENFLLYKRLRQLRLLLYPYLQNYAVLLRFHQRHQRIGGTDTFWSHQLPFGRWNLQKNVNASLLNYLSAAVAVIDISRSFSKDELCPVLLAHYQQWIKTQFVDRIELNFIRELRDYILHYKYLAIGVSFSKNFEDISTNKLYLTSSDLLQWKGWNVQQKTFIGSQESKFNFMPLIIQYHDAFIYTQNWLFLMAIQSHRERLQSLITEMIFIHDQSQKNHLTSAVPFRISVIRYLKWLVSIDDTRTRQF